MTGRTHISDRFRRLSSLLGVPVSCEIYVEVDEDGIPEIQRSVEIEGSRGIRILSQSVIDEEEVLMIYRNWRRRPENQDRIRRVEAPIVNRKFKIQGYEQTI